MILLMEIMKNHKCRHRKSWFFNMQKTYDQVSYQMRRDVIYSCNTNYNLLNIYSLLGNVLKVTQIIPFNFYSIQIKVVIITHT